MEEVKTRKIGRLTFGITLVLLGILVIIATFFSIDILRFGLIIGPIIFISLGLEIIYYSRKDGVNIKYDIIGIILTFFMIFFASIFSIGNYFINKVVYSNDIKNEIVNSLKDEDIIYNFSDKPLSINNMSNIPINLTVKNDELYNKKTVSVHMEYEEKNLNIVSFFMNRGYDAYNYTRANYSDNILSIVNGSNLKSIDITVFTDSPEELKLIGDITLNK